jgi:hypothetical protein
MNGYEIAALIAASGFAVAAVTAALGIRRLSASVSRMAEGEGDRVRETEREASERRASIRAGSAFRPHGDGPPVNPGTTSSGVKPAARFKP